MISFTLIVASALTRDQGGLRRLLRVNLLADFKGPLHSRKGRHGKWEGKERRRT